MAKLIKSGDSSNKDYSFVKGLLVGKSGSGKTTCCSKAPMPFFVEPSTQAYNTIRATNELANVWLVDSNDDFEDLIYSLSNYESIRINELPAIKFTLRQDPARGKEVYGEITCQTVILDDLEVFQSIMIEHISKGGQMQLQNWMTLQDKMMKLLRTVKDLPCNVIAVAKPEPSTDGDSIVYDLSLAGKKFCSSLPGLFNVMGYSYKKDLGAEGGIEYVVGFSLPEKYPTKGHPSLEAVEVPDPSLWWAKIREHDGGTVIPKRLDRDLLPSDADKEIRTVGAKKKREETLDSKVSKLQDKILGIKELDALKTASDYVTKFCSENSISDTYTKLLKTSLENVEAKLKEAKTDGKLGKKEKSI